MYRSIIRPILFCLSPEWVHKVGSGLLRFIAGVAPLRWAMKGLYSRAGQNPYLIWKGLHFSQPIGLAAGFDKNGKLPRAVEMLGFGFMEVGSVTAQSWTGNPTPRLFRLPEDKALINRMGLNNEGADAIAQRLSQTAGSVAIPLLVNVAKTPAPGLEGDGAVADYVESVNKCQNVADAIVLNISCPNSGDGRTFEDPELLSALLSQVKEVLSKTRKPLLVKLSPDLEDDVFDTVVELSLSHEVDGFVACNTSTNRETLSTSAQSLETIGAGGLSGAPLLQGALSRVHRLRQKIGEELLIIGVGGIFGPEDAQRMLQEGANLVEGYTGFVYEGPGYAARIAKGLEELS